MVSYDPWDLDVRINSKYTDYVRTLFNCSHNTWKRAVAEAFSSTLRLYTVQALGSSRHNTFAHTTYHMWYDTVVWSNVSLLLETFLYPTSSLTVLVIDSLLLRFA